MTGSRTLLRIKPPPVSERAWCHARLQEVSRTFAVCIKLLPPALEWPVALAYLLCRIADTIEDNPAFDASTKTGLLNTFSESLTDGAAHDVLIGKIHEAFAQPRDADQRLNANAGRVVTCYHALPRLQRQAIRPWVAEMCRGMAAFSQAHPGAAPGQVDALDDLPDLDRYCYFVAGTVGHLLTDLFRLHHHRVTARHYRRLKPLATGFGLGLQLTNIIKDVADDRRRGWSFVPRKLCRLFDTDPEHFLDGDQAHRDAAAAVMERLIGKARRHLDEALTYCCSLPRSQYRMRVFCLTPLLFAIRTLRQAAEDPRLLDPDHKVKITRKEVKRIVRTTLLIAPNNHLTRAYYRHLANAPVRLGRADPGGV